MDEIDVEGFQYNGSLHVKGAFSTDEVVQYRSRLMQKFDLGGKLLDMRGEIESAIAAGETMGQHMH